MTNTYMKIYLVSETFILRSSDEVSYGTHIANISHKISMN